MTSHLLERYAALGIRLTADSGRLAIDAPDGALTPGLVGELKRNKPALLAALTVPEPAPGTRRIPLPSTPGRPAATAPVQPGLVHPGDGRPAHLGDQAGGPAAIPERTSAAIPAAAIDATAGQVEGLGDLLPATGEWDELPEPEPCPTCGGIDCWWGLWDERRCERCEPSGQRSLLLANRAARLRERTASGRR
jgi:hypothetical protein